MKLLIAYILAAGALIARAENPPEIVITLTNLQCCSRIETSTNLVDWELYKYNLSDKELRIVVNRNEPARFFRWNR